MRYEKSRSVKRRYSESAMNGTLGALLSVKEMQKVKDEAKEPELITVKEAAETLNLSEDYVRKIKDKLPHVKQGNSKQGRILFVKEGLMDAYLNAVGKDK